MSVVLVLRVVAELGSETTSIQTADSLQKQCTEFPLYISFSSCLECDPVSTVALISETVFANSSGLAQCRWYGRDTQPVNAPTGAKRCSPRIASEYRCGGARRLGEKSNPEDKVINEFSLPLLGDEKFIPGDASDAISGGGLMEMCKQACTNYTATHMPDSGVQCKDITIFTVENDVNCDLLIGKGDGSFYSTESSLQSTICVATHLYKYDDCSEFNQVASALDEYSCSTTSVLVKELESVASLGRFINYAHLQVKGPPNVASSVNKAIKEECMAVCSSMAGCFSFVLAESGSSGTCLFNSNLQLYDTGTSSSDPDLYTDASLCTLRTLVPRADETVVFFTTKP